MEKHHPEWSIDSQVRLQNIVDHDYPTKGHVENQKYEI